MKTLYWIRHGTAEHNILYKKYGEKIYFKYRDTSLVLRGVEQAQKLRSTFNLNEIDIVLVSPLLRTLQTATTIFKDDVKIIAIDELLEYPQNYHLCNHRKDKSVLKNVFPNVDFSRIKECSTWTDKKETIDQLKLRLKFLYNWIKLTNFQNIAIVSHNTLIATALDIDTEIPHCIPIKQSF